MSEPRTQFDLTMKTIGEEADKLREAVDPDEIDDSAAIAMHVRAKYIDEAADAVDEGADSVAGAIDLLFEKSGAEETARDHAESVVDQALSDARIDALDFDAGVFIKARDGELREWRRDRDDSPVFEP